jgi:flagellar motility protein MotE (MotC chaperone)
MRHLLNLSSDEMEALVEHREKLDAELEQLRENRMLFIINTIPMVGQTHGL